MTIQEFTDVIRYFKDESKTIHDLDGLFQRETAGKEAISGTESVSYLDAIFEFTNRALGRDERIDQHYFAFRNNIAAPTVYRNACRCINGKSNDRAIFDSWKEYLRKNELTVTRETKLKQMLTYILDFLEHTYPSTSEKCMEFLRKIRDGVPVEDLLGTRAASGKAMELISEAIQGSAKKCVIFTGAPGTGKTWCVEEYVKETTGQDGTNNEPHPNWAFVQFHSSYDYTDFVEGLRPVQVGDAMQFVRMDGTFKSFCRRAAEDSAQTFYFIIDEINRADLGRVFGELMYCLEKRGEAHRTGTQYANLPTCGGDGTPISDGRFQDGFYIPENVVLIGTMNDIDRSVETFDFALRRRFDWVEIDANTVMETSLASMKARGEIVGEITPELVERIRRMNETIARQSGLGPEFAIGPAYFKGYDGNGLEKLWRRNIEPILREYMRGRQRADTDAFLAKCKAALFSEGGSGEPARPGAPE